MLRNGSRCIFPLMWLNLRAYLVPSWHLKKTQILFKCFFALGCLVAVGCVYLLCLTPFPCPLLRFDDEKNRKSRKRYMHLHPGSVSAFFPPFLQFTKLTRRSVGSQKCTNTPQSVPCFCSWMICCYPLAKINNIAPQMSHFFPSQ